MSKRAVLVILLVFVGAIAVVAWLRQRSYNHYNAGEVTALETKESTTSDAAVPQPVRTSQKEAAGHPMDEATAVQPSTTTAKADGSAASNDWATNDSTMSGRYQVYRQGNLTWRLDTEIGTACVLFATDEEWQKPRVYRRACAAD